MKQNLTLQTASALERIEQSLLGATQDDLKVLMLKLDQLSKKANEICNISISTQIGEFD
jgi:hypothetical protein